MVDRIVPFKNKKAAKERIAAFVKERSKRVARSEKFRCAMKIAFKRNVTEERLTEEFPDDQASSN